MDALPQDIFAEIVTKLLPHGRVNLLSTCRKYFNTRWGLLKLRKCGKCDRVSDKYTCPVCPCTCDLCGLALSMDDAVVFIYGPFRWRRARAVYNYVDRIIICKHGCWFRCGCGSIMSLRTLQVILIRGVMTPCCFGCQTMRVCSIFPSYPDKIIHLSNALPRVIDFVRDEIIYDRAHAQQWPTAPSHVPTKCVADPKWLGQDS